jgi:predicted RNase H-like nuclease (RuvC/YqgF family)
MRVVFLAVVFAALCLAHATALPPGYNSANELATVLANEPDAARFAAAGFGGDTITFKDGGGDDHHHDAAAEHHDGGDADSDTAEFDAQIEQINHDLKKLKGAIKESEECSRRLTEQQAEVRSLQEQKEHLEKEKEKRLLQTKLEKQMKDLAEINRMSRSLRAKFSELKHTQKLIKTKMSGTRSSLSQLDSDSEPQSSSDLSESTDAITSEVDAMQKAQTELIAREHKSTAQAVKKTLSRANKVYTSKGH